MAEAETAVSTGPAAPSIGGERSNIHQPSATITTEAMIAPAHRRRVRGSLAAGGMAVRVAILESLSALAAAARAVRIAPPSG